MALHYQVIEGNNLDILKRLPSDSIHCVVTSPPYYPSLRDYGIPGTKWGDGWFGCLTYEPTHTQFIQHLIEIFAEVKRVLRDDGLLFVNLGDSTVKKNLTVQNLKKGDLYGIPWAFAFAMRDDGWYLKNDLIWHKPDSNPKSYNNRFGEDHEYMFMFSKTNNYYFDKEAVKEPAVDPTSLGLRNKRTVWKIATAKYKGLHFASFPVKLAATCIKAATSSYGVDAANGNPFRRIVEKERVATRPAKNNKIDSTKKANRDPERHCTITRTVGWVEPENFSGNLGRPIVLDPFSGSGTTGVAAIRDNCHYVGIELNSEYAAASLHRIGAVDPVFSSQQDIFPI